MSSRPITAGDAAALALEGAAAAQVTAPMVFDDELNPDEEAKYGNNNNEDEEGNSPRDLVGGDEQDGGDGGDGAHAEGDEGDDAPYEMEFDINAYISEPPVDASVQCGASALSELFEVATQFPYLADPDFKQCAMQSQTDNKDFLYPQEHHLETLFRDFIELSLTHVPPAHQKVLRLDRFDGDDNNNNNDGSNVREKGSR